MSDTPSMTSSRPYLLRALYEWIIDNGMTPLMLVDAGMRGVDVPSAFVENGRIILNISMNAVQGLEMGDTFISFKGRFNGVVQEVLVPVAAVQAIYARETSAGMMFPDEPESEPVSAQGATAAEDADSDSGSDKSGEHPHLRVIK